MEPKRSISRQDSWLSVVKWGVPVLITAFLAVAVPLLEASESSASAPAPHGVVPVGATNEGRSGSPYGPATGIIDITASPCVPVIRSVKKYESYRSRITLLQGSRIIARWDVYGMQRIAWVEPVGSYEVRSSAPFTPKKPVRVSSSRVARVDMTSQCV